jgi:malonyl-CoA/methylmalonyl-CoA synthetase
MSMITHEIPLLAQAERHRGRAAIVDAERRDRQAAPGSRAPELERAFTQALTYDELLDASAQIAAALLAGGDDLGEQRVAFSVTPGFRWVAVLWGIWRAGAIAVPLPLGCPLPEFEYFLSDTGAETLIFDACAKKTVAALPKSRHLRKLDIESAFSAVPATLPKVSASRRAMILYTSGTTSRPKGVVTTHENITAQIAMLVRAWEWRAEDRILLCLPLHHVHGIINVLSCALWSGAVCEMLPRFDAATVWDRIGTGDLTLFMAVPTIYNRLIATWESSSPERQKLLSEASRRLRLMVSGSAALPVTTLERWRQISGHTLLERYGMTEIGMALSNPLHGERVPGSVGRPFPDIAVRLVNEHGENVEHGAPGEIEVRGPTVFKEYWSKPEATREAFRDGWFRTGDTALVENGVYRILGRTSIDIIKTGGHKVSALEIEEVLRQHETIAECAVVGVPDPEWGERVAAAVVSREGCVLSLEDLRTWAKDRLANYKVPSRLLTVDELPRNAMGKVMKPAVVELFSGSKQH